MNASDEAAVHHGQAVEHFNRKEYTLAFDHFLAAAELGHIKAQFCVGKMCADGDFYRVSGEVGLKEDRAEAVRWYQRAAEAGLPAAQKCLGLCFCQGRGVAKNPAMGRKWLVLAAKQRDKNALFFLGNYYHLSWGNVRNDAKAYRWYRMAASRGDREATKVLENWSS